MQLDFMGLKLKNPIIVAAGPWSGDCRSIQKCIDAGAAAVITETIYAEEQKKIGPYIYYKDGELLNISLYGHHSIEEWEGEIERLNKKDSYLICSIQGSSPSELAYIAKKAQRLGADALQLDIFAPMDTVSEIADIKPHDLYQLIKKVVNSVNIPIMVRLPHNIHSTTEYIAAIENAGISAISTIESLRAIQGVDIQRRAVTMPVFGGYTGRHIRPISLASTATLSKISNCQISSVGGVENYENVLEFIMLGATTVQLGSIIMLQGYHIINETIEKLNKWMNEQQLNSYEDIRGSALHTLTSHDKIPEQNVLVSLCDGCNDINCMRCVTNCVYEALKFENSSLVLDKRLCTGCGICSQNCPKNILKIITQ